MNRCEMIRYIEETYGVSGDMPWKDSDNLVFRHKENQKWFALIMDVPRYKLGLIGSDPVSVVNLKCDPLLSGSFKKEEGIMPAYHMSKVHWISVLLDGTVDEDKLIFLLEMSFSLTK